jgi:hypothetical protein
MPISRLAAPRSGEEVSATCGPHESVKSSNVAAPAVPSASTPTRTGPPIRAVSPIAVQDAPASVE